MTACGTVDTSRLRGNWDKLKWSSREEAKRGTQRELEEQDRADDAARQLREDEAARAYLAERRLAEEYQRVLARREDARAILRDDPNVSGRLEVEIAAAEARTTVLVARLPGTPQEIEARLQQRGATLEGSANPPPSSHAPQ